MTAENDARLTDAACHDCCDGWTESGGRGHDSTCAEDDAPQHVGWIPFPGKVPVCQDCGTDWQPVRRGECIKCGSDKGPLHTRVIPPGQDPSADHGVYFCDCTTDDHERPHTYAIPPGTGDTDAAL